MESSLHSAYDALAAAFAARFPARRQGARAIGREAEFPIVDQAGRAVDIAQLWPLLLRSAKSTERGERQERGTAGVRSGRRARANGRSEEGQERGEREQQRQGRRAEGQFLTPHPSSLTPLKVKRDAVNTDLIVGLEGASYSYALEVGKSTIELNIGPCATLFELESAFHTALERLAQAAAQLRWRVLGYGVQPLTPPTRDLLSPKQRYRVLADIMGADWLWYTVTASDQTHVDVSRDEAVTALNFGNLMAAVVVALCANSPVSAGAPTGDCSAREGRMIHAPYGQRHGMISHPYADLTDFVARLSRLPALLRREGERLLPDGRTFADVLRADYPAARGRRPVIGAHCFSAFLLHDHYVWHSARLRAAYGTVELRPACQQPPHESMAAAALYLGLIEGHEEIAAYVRSALAPAEDRTLAGCWPRMKRYHRQVIRAGLAAPEPAPGFLAKVLALAQAALARRGYGEERMLTPLWQRLEQRENPAQRARRIFAEEGVEGLIALSDVERFLRERYGRRPPHSPSFGPAGGDRRGRAHLPRAGA